MSPVLVPGSSVVDAVSSVVVPGSSVVVPGVSVVLPGFVPAVVSADPSVVPGVVLVPLPVVPAVVVLSSATVVVLVSSPLGQPVRATSKPKVRVEKVRDIEALQGRLRSQMVARAPRDQQPNDETGPT